MCRWLFDAMPEIGQRITEASYLLLCLDFDGTLAPIKEDPAQVYLSPQMQRVLLSLGSRENVSLAVVSGRDRADLQAHVNIPGLYYAGNHGLDISGNGLIFVEPKATACSQALEAFAADLTKQLEQVPGAFLENKGLTLSVHYRMVAAAADREKVLRAVLTALVNTDQPFQLTMGNKVYEIRPRVSWNKGSAVRWIQELVGHPEVLVIYLGDDVTDEDAFATISEGITIRVGSFAETRALYHLEGPAEVRRFLEWVEDLLRQQAVRAAALEEAQNPCYLRA